MDAEERNDVSPGDSHELRLSLRAVNRARHVLELARARESSRREVTGDQQRLLAALEGYAAALAGRGHPMPYRMRSELAMYRAMFDPRRPPVR